MNIKTESLKMDKYYKITSEVEAVVIPLNLGGYEWSLYINHLKGYIIIYEDDTRLELMHKHVLAQIVLRVDKKLASVTKRLYYNEKKIIRINITIAEKLALEYHILELGIHHVDKYNELLAQEIINQLHKFDTNLPDNFLQLATLRK